MPNYQEILKAVGYPTDVLVLDFETYFDQDYSLSKMSTIEYVTSPQFELLGLGYQFLDNGQSQFLPPNLINGFLQTVKNKQNTVVFCIQNSKFDALILKEKFGINPPYVIDTIDLARHYDARMSHHLKDLAEMFGLQPKGQTVQFKGLHWEDMSEEQRKALEEYCLNDIDLETKLFKILLPMLSNPAMELALARHTLKLYLEPQLKFDMPGAYSLIEKMQEELDRAMQEVKWVLDYEN